MPDYENVSFENWSGESFSQYENRLTIQTYVDKIIIHHSQTKKDTPLNIHKYHRDTMGWVMVGYTYIIDKEGIVYGCRPLNNVPASVKNHNRNSVAICLIGDYDEESWYLDSKQAKACINLVKSLLDLYKIDTDSVKGHRDFQGVYKNCPGINVDLEEFRREVAKR